MASERGVQGRPSKPTEPARLREWKAGYDYAFDWDRQDIHWRDREGYSEDFLAGYDAGMSDYYEIIDYARQRFYGLEL